MARITNYSILSTVASGDLIPISDTSDANNTLFNVTVGTLSTFFNENGVWTPVTGGINYSGGSVGITTTNTDNDSTNVLDIAATKNSTGTGYATSIKGINTEVENSGSAQINTIAGVRSVAKHSGTGDGYFLSGVLSTTTNEGSGNVSGFYGTYTSLNSNGTGVQDVDYMIGQTIAMNFNNPNLDANRVGAINAQLNFNAVTTINTEAYVMLLDTDFTGVTGTDVTVNGDFSYLLIKPHTLAGVPDVTGTARAINSESTLPSYFAGNIGIKAATPAFELDVTGQGRFTGTLTCQTLVQTSQRDQKKDIADIDKTPATRIPFKEYKYKSESGERKRYGVVVEDIEAHYPELVHTDPNGIKGINYIDLLVKRVAELEKEIDDLSSRVKPISYNEKAGTIQVTIDETVYNIRPSIGEGPVIKDPK